MAGLPDYTSLIANDPGYQALTKELSAEGISDAAARASAFNSALIRFGIVPDFGSSAQQAGFSPDTLSALQGDIRPETAGLAKQNTEQYLSILGRLNEADTQAKQKIMADLAARGMLSSGELGYRLGQEGLNYKQGYSSALNSLMDLLNQIQDKYVQGTNARRQQQLSAAQAAYQNAVNAALSGAYDSGVPGGGGSDSTPPPPSAPGPSPSQMPVIKSTYAGALPAFPSANPGSGALNPNDPRRQQRQQQALGF